MQEFLDNLTRLEASALHARAAAASKRYAVAAWELAVCLLAMERAAAFRAFDCASVAEYAERQLGIGAFRAHRLLTVARLMERFPLLSAACREGRLCFSKLREVSRVVAPETEAQWLAFALTHSSREVERAVALAPRQHRKETAAREGDEQALFDAREGGSSLGCTAGSSSLSSTAVAGSASTTDADSLGASGSPSRGGDADATQQPAPSGAARPAAPAPPRLVKVELWMTPDQFAIWDQAVDRARSQKKGRLSKEAALETLARHYLAGGDARTRTNHPVVLRVEATSGAAFYETSRGVMPASPEAVDDAPARERGSFVATAEQPPVADVGPAKGDEYVEVVQDEGAADSGNASIPTTHASTARRPDIRKPVPLALRRQALARASYRCQRCAATKELEVDHVDPVCDGGGDAGNLQVLCRACHGHKHSEAFAKDARYIFGRAAGVARRRGVRTLANQSG